MKNLSFLCWAFFTLPLVNAQTTIYVSPQGNDQYTGSAAAPLTTIHKAAEKAVAKKEQHVTILLQVLARYPNYDSTARAFHGTAADALEQAVTPCWHVQD